jgi:hypothetical protein
MAVVVILAMPRIAAASLVLGLVDMIVIVIAVPVLVGMIVIMLVGMIVIMLMVMIRAMLMILVTVMMMVMRVRVRMRRGVSQFHRGFTRRAEHWNGV